MMKRYGTMIYWYMPPVKEDCLDSNSYRSLFGLYIKNCLIHAGLKKRLLLSHWISLINSKPILVIFVYGNNSNFAKGTTYGMFYSSNLMNLGMLEPIL